MPKVTAATLAVTGLLLIALTGCSGGAHDAGDERTSPVASESAAPLVAETPETDPNEEGFLKSFRDLQVTYPSIIPNATDEQLLAAGLEACERLAAGEESTDISLIEGEKRAETSQMYLDSISIVTAARTTLCP